MPWSALEQVPDLSHFPVGWQQFAGDKFPALRSLCLVPSTYQPISYPCPHNCGCWHRIIHRHDHTAVLGTCQCKPPHCPDLELSIEQITPLDVSRAKLGRALCQALQLDPKPAELGLPNTAQIGSWSAATVPAILTIQFDPATFQSIVADLVAQLNQPIILLAPTNAHLNAHCQSLLNRIHAAFFALETIVTLHPDGTIHPTHPPSDLFAPLHPSTNPTIHPSTNPSIHSPHSALCTPKYALRKGLGCWHLIFDGQEAVLKHERGLFYVAWLLYHPEETPIHALDLMAKIPEIYRHQLGLTPLVNPTTGKLAPLLSGARIQERSLALDDVQAMRALYKKQKELEAILDSDDATEPEKAEALRDLEAIYEFQKNHTHCSKDAAYTASKTVRRAIGRFYTHLRTATHTGGPQHPAIAPFALHLLRYLITPSRTTRSGTLTYEPPANLRWPLETPHA